VGRIIAQGMVRVGKHGKVSKINYLFSVGPGKPMSGHGIDDTSAFSKDMRVLVFYDPEDISRYVAYCSTYWRIQTDEGYLLES
jgi:hypothetical protein